MDTFRYIQPLQPIEPRSGELRPVGRSGVGAAFAEVLAKAVAQREPVHMGLRAKDRLEKAGVKWTPELEGRMGEAMGRFVNRGNRRGLVYDQGAAFVLSVPDWELVDVISTSDLGTKILDDIDAFALLAKED